MANKISHYKQELGSSKCADASVYTLASTGHLHGRRPPIGGKDAQAGRRCMGVIGTVQHTTACQQARRARDRPGQRSGLWSSRRNSRRQRAISSRPSRGLYPFARNRPRKAPPTPLPTRSILLYKPAAPGRIGQLVADPVAGQYSAAECTAAAASASAVAAAADVGMRRGRAPPRRAGS